jgi:hypothetical protein
MENKMRTLFTVLLAVILTGCSGETETPRDAHVVTESEDPALALTPARTNQPWFGHRDQLVLSVDTNWQHHTYGQLTFVSHSLAQKHFGTNHLYAVRLRRDLLHPTGEFASMVVRDGNVPLAFDTLDDAAYYISLEPKKVPSSSDATDLFGLLLAMFGYRSVTNQPGNIALSSLPSEFQDPKQWTQQIVQTPSGWKICSMIVTDPEIGAITFVSVFITQKGVVTVLRKEHVFAAAGYM